MNFSNETKLQGMSVNVLLPTMLIFLYYEDAYFVMAIYIFFFIWFFLDEIPIYKAIYINNSAGKIFVTKTIVLLVSNGLLAFLVKSQGSDFQIILCVGFLLYSSWFGYFEAKKYYRKNKILLDEHFQSENI